MQKTFVIFLLCASAVCVAQNSGKKNVDTKKPASASPAMKNSLDSFSYALGLSIANFYKEQGISSINNSLLLKALNDARNEKPLMDENRMNNCLMGYMQIVRGKKASGNRKVGEAFLAENKNKPGIVTLPSGLQYEIIREGNGPKPVLEDQVKVHYHGTLIDGTVFDSSVQRGEPIVMGLRDFIPGWIEALQLMPVGSKWRLFVPSLLAYGDNQQGPTIKPGSALIFEVELLEIVKK